MASSRLKQSSTITKSSGYLNSYTSPFSWFTHSYFNFKIIWLLNSFLFIWFADTYFRYNRNPGSPLYTSCYLTSMRRPHQCLNTTPDSCWHTLYRSYLPYMNCYYNQIYTFPYPSHMCDLHCCFDTWNYSSWRIYFHNNPPCKLKKKRTLSCLSWSFFHNNFSPQIKITTIIIPNHNTSVWKCFNHSC